MIPEVSLTVAGRAPLSDELRGLLEDVDAEVHESPASVAEFYSRTSLSVAPLLTGGGTSIKVLESLAYGVPTVAAAIAVRGLDLKNGEHLAIADSASAFRDACVSILSRGDEARAMASRGRDEVGRRFSWSSAGATARDAVHTLLGDHVPPRR